MRLKLDENLAGAVGKLLVESGHDVDTVEQEGLMGSVDEVVLAHAAHDSRALLTLDRDFCDVRRYPPFKHNGVIVLRIPTRGKGAVLGAVQRLLPLLTGESIGGQLWIVREDKVRIKGG